MSQNSFERTVLINSAVNNFYLNRDMQEYKRMLEETYLHYSTTTDFASLSSSERVNLLNIYKELRDFLAEMARLKEMVKAAEEEMAA